MQSCTDSVYSSQLHNNLYCASRIVYNSSLYNGTSSNWKADWARFIGKSYSQFVGSNLATAKVKAQQISSNTTNSLAVKPKTCRTKNMTQLTFSTQKREIQNKSSDRKQKPSRHYPNTINTHSSEFQLPLHNRFESIHLPDPTYPTGEASSKFGKNCTQKYKNPQYTNRVLSVQRCSMTLYVYGIQLMTMKMLYVVTLQIQSRANVKNLKKLAQK